MDVCIDTSGIMAVILNEPKKAAILQNTVSATLYAPQSLHWECGNALTAALKRGRIDLAQAVAAVQQYQLIPINFVEVDLSQSLTTASLHRLYAYDAYMIVCALNLNIPLLSLDIGLLTAASTAGVTIIKI